MVQGSVARGDTGLILDHLLAVLASLRDVLEHAARGVEPRQAIDPIRCDALRDGILPVGHEHDVDAHDVRQLAVLSTLRAAAADGPTEYAQGPFLTEEAERLGLSKHLPSDSDDVERFAVGVW